MNHWQQPVRPTDTRTAGWEYLKAIADVGLLQETAPPASVPRDRLVYHDLAGMRPWGSAVVALQDGIGVEEIWSVGGAGRRRYRLANTHPGSVAVARLHIPGIAPITAVSLYNVLDGHPAANLLRVMADLVPLLESVDGERVILGGDFNVYRAVPGRSTKAETVFALLRDLGLHSVGELAIPRPDASSDCACGAAGKCTHVPTWRGYELDHLFVTEALRDQVCALGVDRCTVELGLSDHAALVARLELSSAPVARAWDVDTFTAEVGNRYGSPAADVVAAIVDWAARKDDALRAANIRDREVSDIVIPRAIDPTMFIGVTFRDPGFKPQWLTAIRAAGGALYVSFQYMKAPPFDTVAGREPLRAMLNAIPGVEIQSGRLAGRPIIPLATLAESAALDRFLAVLDRVVDETVPTRRAAAVVDGETDPDEPGDESQQT
jgi:hypothetical protein